MPKELVSCKISVGDVKLDDGEIDLLLALVSDLKQKGDYKRFSPYKEAADAAKREVRTLQPKLLKMLEFSMTGENKHY